MNFFKKQKSPRSDSQDNPPDYNLDISPESVKINPFVTALKAFSDSQAKSTKTSEQVSKFDDFPAILQDEVLTETLITTEAGIESTLHRVNFVSSVRINLSMVEKLTVEQILLHYQESIQKESKNHLFACIIISLVGVFNEPHVKYDGKTKRYKLDMSLSFKYTVITSSPLLTDDGYIVIRPPLALRLGIWKALGDLTLTWRKVRMTHEDLGECILFLKDNNMFCHPDVAVVKSKLISGETVHVIGKMLPRC